MDSVPFLHANRIFTITFVDDLAFADVRIILDQLLSADAFNPTVQASNGFYAIDLDQGSFDVWVHETEVIIIATT